ncbi:MAG: hypothetical protein K940chlam3_00581 [Chlamydiae bacterium]|nr:hypothetical protein [Chlamydiota bacterium]
MIEESVIKEEARKFLGIRVSAIVEVLVFLAFMMFIDYVFGSGNRFQGTSPHPFWIIILIVSVQYGTIEGIMAAALSTLALYAGNIPEIQFNESLFQYNSRLAMTPTLWFIAAVVIGEMHMRVIGDRKKYRELAIAAQEESNKTAESYEVLKEKKEHLEIRLVSQMRSFTYSLKSLRGMESMSPGQIFLSLTDMVKEIVGPKKFSVYTFSDNGFEVMLSEGWEEDEPFKRRFLNKDPLYREITTGKRLLSVVNPEDEVIFEGEGLIAAPILDTQSGQIYGMLKIEDIEFHDLNISNFWVIETLTELVGTAFSNAQKYDLLFRHSIYSSWEENIYSFFMYNLQKENLANLMTEAKVPMSEIDIELKSGQEELRKELTSVRSALEFILRKSIVKNETVYQMGRDELHYRVLLPFASLDDAKKELKKIEQSISEHPDIKDYKLSINANELDCKALAKAKSES